MLRVLVLAALLALPAARAASCALVAVAANFEPTARLLGDRYAQAGGCLPAFASASTGQLYAQALAGAPFDIFLAADVERPQRLAQARGLEAPVVYALGQLALVSAPGGGDPLARLRGGDFRFLALADPATAPYGRASLQVLASLGIEVPPGRRATAGNVAQAYAFVATGAADIGLTARSLLRPRDTENAWPVDPSLHAPVEQAAVLMTGSDAARGFLDFILSDDGRAVLLASGYGVGGQDG